MALNRKNIYIIAFCLYISAVLALCLIKTDGLPEIEKTIFGIPTDKVVHFLMFMPFTILSSLVFIKQDTGKLQGLATIVILSALGAGLAFGTEQLQALTGYRSCEILDYYADLAGISAGTAAIAILFLSCRKHLFRR